MKRDILILGVFFLFLGLTLMSVSRTSVEVEPLERWQTVEETEVNPPKESLSVQGDLTNGDRFRVYFTIQMEEEELARKFGGVFPSEVGVIEMNLTDPYGSSVRLPDTLIGIQRGMAYPVELPEGVANVTGTYTVDAKSFPPDWIKLESLRLEREIERKEPFGFLLPVGVVVSVSGIALSIFGVKSSKRRGRKFKGHQIRQKK